MKKNFYSSINSHQPRWKIKLFAKRFPFFLFIVAIFFAESTMAQITAVGFGSWNNPATWDFGVPTAADDVIIGSDFIVTVDSPGAVCNSLQIGDNNATALSGGLSFSGTTGYLKVTGIITLGSINFLTTGTIDMGGVGDAGILECASIVESDPSISGVFNTNSGSIIFTGSFFLPTNLSLFKNLIIKSGNTSLINNIDISGNLSINGGILSLGTYSANRLAAGGTLTVANGAVLRIGGTGTLPGNFTTHSIGSTSTVDYRGTSDQNIAPLNSTQKYGNLNITNAGIKTLAGNITVSGTLTFAATSTRIVLAGNTLTIEGAVNGSLSNNRNFRGSATSNLILKGALNRTIFMDITTIGTTNALNNLTIDHTANTTTLGNSATVYGALTFTAGKLAIGSNTLTLSGTVVNTVSGGLVGSAASNFIFDGTSADATISMDQTSPSSTNRLNYLIINCNPKILTLGNAVELAGTLFPLSGTLASGGNLTLLSTASKTANVSAGASGGGYVTGDVTVERYISSGRKWHLLSVPTSGTQTIKAAWQEGAATGSSISTGYGTWITSNVAGSTSSGFDYVSNGPGLRIYDAATDVWTPVANTTDAVSSNSGYMVFVRGDRGCTSTNSNVSATILRTTGTLNQGDQASVSVGADKFGSVANTLPSAIDFRNLFTTGVIDPVFYVWDPKLGGSRGLGGYQTFVNIGTDYIVTPGGGSYGASGSICNAIQSGQAFIVHATGGTGALQLLEGSKSSSNMLVSKPLTPITPQIRLNVITNNVVIDGLLVQMDNTFAPGIDGMDARKIANTNESFSVLSNGILLAVERRPELKTDDTLFFKSSGLKAQQYQLEIIPGMLQNKLMTAFLEDSYTGINVPVSLADTTKVTFIVNAAVASKDANRFRIVFKSAVVLPLSFTGIKAIEKLQGIEVNWQTANELNVKNYSVEKSTDGSNFTAVFNTAATGNNQLTAQYGWMDETVFAGKNFYQIKSTDNNGSSKYSEIVFLVSKKTKPAITVFPNPVINNQVNVQLLAVVKGNYHFTIYNTTGQAVSTGTLNVISSNEKLIINLPSTVTPGKYQLEIKGEKEFKNNTTLIVM
jgi:hypothetical protein